MDQLNSGIGPGYCYALKSSTELMKKSSFLGHITNLGHIKVKNSEIVKLVTNHLLFNFLKS